MYSLNAAKLMGQREEWELMLENADMEMLDTGRMTSHFLDCYLAFQLSFKKHSR